MKAAVKSKPKIVKSQDFKPSVSDLCDAAARAKKILPILRKTYPQAGCALEHVDALELMIATILSAQCTDKRVNVVTKDLFVRYRTAGDYAKATQRQLEEAIKSTGFFRNKAKNIRAACKVIDEDHGGRVPDTMDELLKLPGVGRKTANLILGDAYGVPGVVCDTHVIRLSRLMGLSRNSDAVKLEYDLMELFNRRWWTLLGHVLIFHGRNVCVARRPDCGNCPVKQHCSYGRHAAS